MFLEPLKGRSAQQGLAVLQRKGPAHVLYKGMAHNSQVLGQDQVPGKALGIVVTHCSLKSVPMTGTRSWLEVMQCWHTISAPATLHRATAVKTAGKSTWLYRQTLQS